DIVGADTRERVRVDYADDRHHAAKRLGHDNRLVDRQIGRGGAIHRNQNVFEHVTNSLCGNGYAIVASATRWSVALDQVIRHRRGTPPIARSKPACPCVPARGSMAESALTRESRARHRATARTTARSA